jgi:hypothetical protein
MTAIEALGKRRFSRFLYAGEKYFGWCRQGITARGVGRVAAITVQYRKHVAMDNRTVIIKNRA